MRFTRVQCRACRRAMPENMAVKCVVTTANGRSLIGFVDHDRRKITPDMFCPECLPNAVAAAVGVDVGVRIGYHSAGGTTTMMATTTIDDLQQHQLVILRRLRNSPLTEFDLSAEVADSSGWDRENAAERISQWLDELAANGWIEIQTAGRSYTYKVATLADAGRELVG